MALGESGKTRAQRIQLDYHRTRDGIQRFRWWLAILALILSLAYSLYVLLPLGSSHISSGPLSLAHTSIQRCAACHGTESLLGIARDAWKPWQAKSLTQMESLCKACHQEVEGHFRARLADSSRDQNCAACHHEHLGRDQQLARVENEACVACHANLSVACAAATPSRLKPDIRDFTLESHGDFRSLKDDPGTVRFDHAQHMLPGQVELGVRGGFSLKDLDDHWRKIYRNSDQDPENSLVQLKCVHCHRREGDQESLAHNAQTQELGVNHAPIDFDQHCAGCHALNYPGREKDLPPLPHAAPWKELSEILRVKIVVGRQTGRVSTPRDQPRETPLPDSTVVAKIENAQAATATNLDLEHELAEVRTGCLKCHQESDVSDEAIRSKGSHELVPSKWLALGSFHHAAHRGMECAFCHVIPKLEAGATRGAVEANSAPEDDQRVMIRGIESCTPCHREETSPFPAALVDDKNLGTQALWASANCVDCHRYHWTRPESPAP